MGDIRKIIRSIVPKQDKIKWGEPVSSYRMVFDSQQNQLEPIYFWMLDFIRDMGWETKKITDNFRASPGSGQFGDMGQRESSMQKQGMEMLGSLNQVIKSVLNLIYDLREFEIRLESYDDYSSSKKDARYRGMLSLKQIWMDTVDIKKGNGSINVMSSQAGFVTLRDLFFMVDDEESLKKISNKKDGVVNDQTSRILTPRLDEFWKWVNYSEKELRKRMNIERSYLKSQVETIKMYSSWMKPYLRAAEELRQKGFDDDAALVHAFSTTMFELVLLCHKTIDDAQLNEPSRDDPSERFKDYKLKRNYHPVMIISFKYRGHVSQRVTQKGDIGFAGGGRIEMQFDSYSLNEQELKIVKKKFEDDERAETMEFSSDIAVDALVELREDIEHFLDDSWKKDEVKEKRREEEDINPFSALGDLFKSLFGFKTKTKREEEGKKVTDIKEVKKDNYVERAVRVDAAEKAAEGLYFVYDIYKKSHGMASAPNEGFDIAPEEKIGERDVEFGDVFMGQGGNPGEIGEKLWKRND
ncbi:MAG: hypothetical protein IH845_00680 [Nanoarchaeota archaeon]|nr:hypothetical protein [Nanoarchaeota archaeon]